MLANIMYRFLVIFFGGEGVIDLQCCNFSYLPNDFSTNFQSCMTIFHHKLLTKDGRLWTNGWTRPSSMTIFVHLFLKSVNQKVTNSDIKYHVTLNLISSVAIPILSNMGPPTNLFLLLKVVFNPLVTATFRFKILQSDAWKSSSPCPWPSTF